MLCVPPPTIADVQASSGFPLMSVSCNCISKGLFDIYVMHEASKHAVYKNVIHNCRADRQDTEACRMCHHTMTHCCTDEAIQSRKSSTCWTYRVAGTENDIPLSVNVTGSRLDTLLQLIFHASASFQYTAPGNCCKTAQSCHHL